MASLDACWGWVGRLAPMKGGWKSEKKKAIPESLRPILTPSLATPTLEKIAWDQERGVPYRKTNFLSEPGGVRRSSSRKDNHGKKEERRGQQGGGMSWLNQGNGIHLLFGGFAGKKSS